jgi:hypothetical protein
MLSSEMQRAHGARNQEKREARKQGKLFFVRIYVESPGSDRSLKIIMAVPSDAKFGIISSMGGARGVPPYHYVELSRKLTAEEIATIVAIDGVKRVDVR